MWSKYSSYNIYIINQTSVILIVDILFNQNFYIFYQKNGVDTTQHRTSYIIKPSGVGGGRGRQPNAPSKDFCQCYLFSKSPWNAQPKMYMKINKLYE